MAVGQKTRWKKDKRKPAKRSFSYLLSGTSSFLRIIYSNVIPSITFNIAFLDLS